MAHHRMVALLGLDRVITILTNELNIREVFSFPKTGDGRDLMMDAPAEISEKQLKELGIKIKGRLILNNVVKFLITNI